MIRCGALLAGELMLATTIHAQELQSTDNHGMGLLQVRSQAIGQSLRLTMPMLIPGDIVNGWRTYAGLTWTNVWANDEAFVLDYEMLDILAGVGYGFNDRWGMAAIVDNRSYFGGAMDSLIEEFHNEFSIDQDGRDTAPRGRSVALRKDPVTGQTDEISSGDMNNTGLSLLVNCNLLQGSSYTLDAAIIENIITMDNSPDFGLHLGVTIGKCFGVKP